jgi:hypothetical protein
MKNTLMATAAALVAGTFVGGDALAASCSPPLATINPLESVLNNITVGPNAGDTSVNLNTDCATDGADSYWSIGGAGGSISSIIVELATFATTNKFGIFDIADPNKRVQIFDGSADSGDSAQISILATGEVEVNFVGSGVFFAGNVFGYYLDSSVQANGGLWHSDTSLNTDGFDHMVAIQGTGTDTIQVPTRAPGEWSVNEWVLAFEDLKLDVSDKDFTDFVVIVESVHPVPVPAALPMLGAAIAGLGFAGWRKRKASSV